MPDVKPGESEKDFIHRCIPVVLADGTAKNGNQAVAVCYAFWKKGKKSMDAEELKVVLDEFAAMKMGKRNSAADVERLKQIQVLIGELLTDEQEEVATEGAASAGDGYIASGKAAKDPNVGGGVDRTKIPDEDFAGKDKSFPIVKPGDVSDAASSIGRAGPSNYSTDKLKANIIKIAKRKGASFTAQLPDTWKKEEGIKSLDLSYAKSLGIIIPDLAVKSVGADEIHGYTMIWGNPDKVDVEQEFFTQDSDFWDKSYGKAIRPLTWDHDQDKSLKADVRIGTITDFGDDDIGRWYTATLDRAHRYRKAIDGLIEQGALGSSSDSVLQYIQRQKTKSGATWLAVWPWVGSALTATPAEPRLLASIEYAKSIGVDFKFPEATDVKQARAMEATLKAKSQHLRKLME